MTTQPVVGVVFGSESDRKVMAEAGTYLDRFEIPYEVQVLSAHRNPARTARYARDAKERGIKVLIAGAGMAAHLAGVMAAHTTLPVIGVPIGGSSLGGFDALLSMVQMPGGIPVATVAIGTAGARNAAILAAEILALSDAGMAARLEAFRRELESN
ncbi:MAG: 5-(carboxyamino)imidazole ribonucleotide mutase [Candidatus Eiseniibacteriota bacterium]